ncbi:hypothetical protein L1049_011978 [Liquidambar formosana]|uniref:Uncharacterized protein n=1 Tax=Liquidambar formosana TaxID=63359 RepID=A0AAP0RS62_LIQFO
MLEEYLAYFDAGDENSQSMLFDTSQIMGTENPISDQASLTEKFVDGGTEASSYWKPTAFRSTW